MFGYPIQVVVSQPNICRKCRNYCYPGNNFCNNCVNKQSPAVPQFTYPIIAAPKIGYMMQSCNCGNCRTGFPEYCVSKHVNPNCAYKTCNSCSKNIKVHKLKTGNNGLQFCKNCIAFNSNKCKIFFI